MSRAIPILIAVFSLAALILLPRLGRMDAEQSTSSSSVARSSNDVPIPPAPDRPPATILSNTVKGKVPFQVPIDRMPEGGPYVFRVTELEMEPGAKIFEHRQLGAGAHYVLKGSITIEDLENRRAATYTPGQGYYEGMDWLHRAQNDGKEANRVLMFDILPASRGFDGQQKFTSEGRHNEGEIRSGPYVQMPLKELPPGPLMLRITELAFGPKAKVVEHTRLGPTIFFVQEGTATIRKDWANSSITYGTNGYFWETGREPFQLENKPAAPAKFLSVEILPASLGEGPSTIPTGN